MGSEFLISRVVGDRGGGHEVEDDRDMISLKSTPRRTMDGLPSESQQALIDELSDLVCSLVIRVAFARPTRCEWRDTVRQEEESRKLFTQILQGFAREGILEVQFQTGLKANKSFAYAIGLKRIPCLAIDFADEKLREPGVNWRAFLERKGRKGMRVRNLAHEAFLLTPLRFIDSRPREVVRFSEAQPNSIHALLVCW